MTDSNLMPDIAGDASSTRVQANGSNTAPLDDAAASQVAPATTRRIVKLTEETINRIAAGEVGEAHVH